MFKLILTVSLAIGAIFHLASAAESNSGRKYCLQKIIFLI